VKAEPETKLGVGKRSEERCSIDSSQNPLSPYVRPISRVVTAAAVIWSVHAPRRVQRSMPFPRQTWWITASCDGGVFRTKTQEVSKMTARDEKNVDKRRHHMRKALRSNLSKRRWLGCQRQGTIEHPGRVLGLVGDHLMLEYLLRLFEIQKEGTPNTRGSRGFVS
jgi:hypothetical protein